MQNTTAIIMNAQKKVSLSLPSWVAKLYIFLSAVLIPWTAYLSITLPTRHLSRHWDVSWVGLDIGIVLALLLTGLLAIKRSRWVVMTATVSGSFLLVDAWFDIVSERPGFQLEEAIVLAVFFELPLTIISFLIAHRVLMQNIE